MTFTLVGLLLDFVSRYPASATLTGNVDAMVTRMVTAGMRLDADAVQNAKTWLLAAEARLGLPGKDGVYMDSDIRRVAVAAKSYLG